MNNPTDCGVAACVLEVKELHEYFVGSGPDYGRT